MSRSVNPVPQFFAITTITVDGELQQVYGPVLDGKMFYFESGTDTPLTTYKDINETIANEHPVRLDAEGRLPNVFFTGTAKQTLTDSAGTLPTDPGEQIWTRDPVGANASLAAYAEWSSITFYSISDIVTGSDGLYYVSIVGGNQGFDPAAGANPARWTEFKLLRVWNINETYAINIPVIGSNGSIYTSKVGSNAGNDPVSSPTQWSLHVRLDVVNGYLQQQFITEVALVDGANIAWGLNASQEATVTLAGNRTLDNPTGQNAGSWYHLRVVQDATGTRTLSYGSAYKFGGAGAPALSTGSANEDVLAFRSNGTDMQFMGIAGGF